MSLIVEDGTDVPNAESYVQATDLDTYCTAFGLTNIPSASQEPFLRRAAQAMEAMRWMGTPTYQDQALQWPRMAVFARSAINPLPQNTIPQDIQRGQMQLALDLYAIDQNPGFDAGASGRITSLTQSVSGAVSQTKVYDNTGRSVPPSPTAKSDALFAPFLASGGNAFLMRA